MNKIKIEELSLNTRLYSKHRKGADCRITKISRNKVEVFVNSSYCDYSEEELNEGFSFFPPVESRVKVFIGISSQFQKDSSNWIPTSSATTDKSLLSSSWDNIIEIETGILE